MTTDEQTIREVAELIHEETYTYLSQALAVAQALADAGLLRQKPTVADTFANAMAPIVHVDPPRPPPQIVPVPTPCPRCGEGRRR